MNRVEEQLKARIAAEGPISVADYMAAANAHYYATRDPLGADGDFTTAPEISQMFGELVGLWLADLWLRVRRPKVHYVELGPGRGTLAADALRAMAKAGLAPDVHLVETSPILRAAQAERLPTARWHDGIASLPEKGPLLVVANEFFDALPVMQFAGDETELRVDWRGGRFVRDSTEGIFERSPLALSIAVDLARRLRRQGGAALILDYGHEGGSGDTLQAVSRHEYADPFEAPGERDLTAHVDFSLLAYVAEPQGVRVHGPVGQGDWLQRMGIDARAEALRRASPGRAAEIAAARERLAASNLMGRLFKAMALVDKSWPEPAGFA